MPSKTIRLAATLVLTVMLSACGGGSTTIKAADTTTIGQQLLDLQKAREAGAISQKEYESQKKKILKKKL